MYNYYNYYYSVGDSIPLEHDAPSLPDNARTPTLRNSEDVQDFIKEDKFIIPLSQLLKLAPTTCMFSSCSLPVTRSIKRSGAALIIEFVCPSGHIHNWTSSPTHLDKSSNSIFAINLLFANSILLSGSNITKIDMLCNLIGLSIFSESLYFRYQKMYMCPSVMTYWNGEQKRILESVKERPRRELVVSADGRCDSPGRIQILHLITSINL